MVRPAATDEVARVLAYCNSVRLGVVPQGGRTGLAGGAESREGEIVLALDRFDRIESLDPVSRTAVAGAGVTLAALAERAAAHGLAPGIDLAVLQLDDPVFFAPFVPFFSLTAGRPAGADGVLPAADVPEVPVPAGL